MSLPLIEKNFWLSQFSHSQKDSITANKLLDACSIISHEQFTDNLSFLLDNSFEKKDKIALFVERELKKNNGMPNRMYKVRKIKIVGKKKYKRQSYGAAIQVVFSKTQNIQKIGSEGLIANFLTKKIQYQRNHANFILQPSINELKNKKVNKIVIVSDLIGTGQRIIDMINSIWKSETIKSWHSLKLIEFIILCYASTEKAEEEILKHKAKVKIIKVMPCPTIYTEFNNSTRDDIINLCQRYGEYSNAPLGYKNSGILMSFAHSIPNNCPAILGQDYSTAKKTWRKLFRTPYQSGSYMKSKSDSYYEIEKNTYIRLGFEYMQDVINEIKFPLSQRRGILLAFLLNKGLKNKMDIISFTKASLEIIYNMVNDARKHNYLKLKEFQLRAPGRKIINMLRSMECSHQKLIDSEMSLYYPTSLRAPKTGV